MLRVATRVILAVALLAPAFSQRPASPLVGRWDLAVASASGTHACWLGVTEKGGDLEVWYQPPEATSTR